MKIIKKKPGIFVLLWHLATCVKWCTLTLLGKIGLLLLILNAPVGWGGAAICAIYAAKSEHKAFWAAIAFAIYIASWGLLLLGAVLAGKDVVATMKKRRKYVIAAWHRARN